MIKQKFGYRTTLGQIYMNDTWNEQIILMK